MEMLSDNPKTHPIVNNCWDYTKRYNYGRISVNASERPYRRALCFLNTFIKVMKSRWHYFLFCYERSYIVIEGVEISIRIRERSKRVYDTEKSGYITSTLRPIGLLSFLKNGRRLLLKFLRKNHHSLLNIWKIKRKKNGSGIWKMKFD